MELKTSHIPAEFLHALPQGMRLARRGEQDFLVVEALYCPNGHNLLVDSVRIHNEASVKLKLKVNEQSGFVFIDAFWGSHAKLFSFLPPVTGQAVHSSAFCPYCDCLLTENSVCTADQCGSTLGFVLYLPGGKNRIHICARLGCPGHRLEINALPEAIVASVSKINYFGHGAEELFGGI
jgi:hypothetical protein